MPRSAPRRLTKHSPWQTFKLLLALSRSIHGVLDMATPAFAALLALGHFPNAAIMSVGLITAVAGYTAVYALNDLVGYRSDRAKLAASGGCDLGSDLDAVLVRHPMACGQLSFSVGLIWTVGWAVTALAGALWLNPVCVLIFGGGCLLETAYCLLWRISPYRAVVSGAVKTLGAVAGIYAVSPSPPPAFVAAVFGCLFFWELGGQNIPNDWTDIEEDRRIGGRTIPVVFGLETSRRLICWSNCLAVILAGAMAGIAPGSASIGWAAGFSAIAAILLLPPTRSLAQLRTTTMAMALFNRASYLPLALMAAATVRAAIG